MPQRVQLRISTSTALVDLKDARLPRELAVDTREGVQLQLDGVAICVALHQHVGQCVGQKVARARGRTPAQEWPAQRTRALRVARAQCTSSLRAREWPKRGPESSQSCGRKRGAHSTCGTRQSAGQRGQSMGQRVGSAADALHTAQAEKGKAPQRAPPWYAPLGSRYTLSSLDPSVR